MTGPTASVPPLKGTAAPASVLSARDVVKYAYDETGAPITGSDVKLLKGVSISVRPGEIHALIGENGAGKSTFIKVLGGAIPAEQGEVAVQEQPVVFGSSRRARELGISVIWQEFSLSPKLSVLENMFLGEEITKRGLLDRSEMRRRSIAALARLGVQIDLDRQIDSLSTSEQQIVEIAKALDRDARVLILDEPTASLTGVEADQLFTVVQELRRKKLGIVLVTHRLDEVFEHSQRITVMKDGATIGTFDTETMTRESLIQKMVGRELSSYFVRPNAVVGEAVLVVNGLSCGRAVVDASIVVRAGEIVALGGLVGAGRTELCRLVVGTDRATAGTVRLRGRDISRWTLRRRLDAGIAFVPEDRKNQGVVLAMSVQRNLTTRSWRSLSWRGILLSPRREQELAESLISDLEIKVHTPLQAAATLSGGNQQRVAIGKWLVKPSSLYIFDEPTRGVDVGARRALYALIAGLVERGAGVLMVSSDLPEVLGMSDRVYIMRAGRIAGEYTTAETDENELLRAMLPETHAEVAS